MERFDVVVAGAGPAGAEFAYRMARRGHRVLVLERDALDREKPCGGGIQTQEILEFGPLPEAVVERHIAAARIVAPDGGILTVPRYLPACGATVKRSVYDRWLSRRAEEAGVDVRAHWRIVSARASCDGVTLRAETPEGLQTVFGRLCAIASGATARELMGALGFEFFKAGSYATTTQYWLELGATTIDERIGDTIEIYAGSSVIPRGYAWIFPKRDVVTVGLGCDIAVLDAEPLRLRARLDAFIAQHPVAAPKLAGGRLVRVDGGPIPFFVAPRLSGESTLLLGDAGGFGNAIHGGGIYQARKSAALAEPFAQAFLATGAPAALVAYAAEATEYFAAYEGRWDVKLRPFFWEDRLVNATVRRAARGDDGLVRAMGIILNSDQSHEAAYQLLEPRMLDLVHDCLREVTHDERRLVDDGVADAFLGDDVLDQAVRHLLHADAKRVRASLALVATAAAGGDPRRAVPLAIAFEMLHTASLIHDDVMDGATVRRGRPCVHVTFGTPVAITAGDALIFDAYRRLLSLDGASAERDAVLRVFSDCALRTCRGQAADVTLTSAASLDDYLRMIDEKTGSMIAAPLEAGAALAGASARERAAFHAFGRAIGTAFQLVDDAIDYLGSEADAAKTLGHDLRCERSSPMLLHCRERASVEERATLDAATTAFARSGDAADLAVIVALFRRLDAVGFTQRLCAAYVEGARRALDGVGREPARAQLLAIADMVGYWGQLAAELPPARPTVDAEPPAAAEEAAQGCAVG